MVEVYFYWAMAMVDLDPKSSVWRHVDGSLVCLALKVDLSSVWRLLDALPPATATATMTVNIGMRAHDIRTTRRPSLRRTHYSSSMWILLSTSRSFGRRRDDAHNMGDTVE